MNPVIKKRSQNPLMDWGLEERSEHFYVDSQKKTKRYDDWGSESLKDCYRLEIEKKDGRKSITNGVFRGGIFLIIAILVLLVVIDPKSVPSISKYILVAIYSIVNIIIGYYFGKT